MKEKAEEGRYGYRENVRERMEFLNFVMENASTAKFSQEHLYKLWNMLCENPLSHDDAQVLFKFLKDRIPDKESVSSCHQL